MSFYITCAIDYPNSRPHIGTAYEKIAADTIARYKRLAGEDVFFLMGLDEHSQNVERRARDEGKTPQDFTDEMEPKFRDAWAAVNVEFDDFIRTTEARHRVAVEAMVARADAAGDFYEGFYSGYYCVSCEAYYQERDLVDGKCPQHETAPDYREEANVFFRLSDYQDRLKAHYEAHPEFVQPDYRRNELLSLLEDGLEDISVSRAASSGWGIPMPGHEGQAVYVWFDALTNYLAAVGFPEETDEYKRYWPADMHLVGKDITRFHAIIWPAMLMSAGLPLPKVVFGHGFVLAGGGRMSKSMGNVMDPVATAERFGADALRYFLLREARFGRDLDFDHDRLVSRYNADLANDLGNLLQRTVGMAMKYREGALGSAGEGVTDLADRGAEAVAEYRQAMEAYDLQSGLKAAWKLVSVGNLAVDRHAPWELAKDPGKAAELDAVLSELAAALRQVAVMLHPFMPERTVAMAAALGIDTSPADWNLDDLLDPAQAPTQLVKTDALFPRLDVEEVIEGS